MAYFIRVIPELDFPSKGFRYKEAAAILAKKFQLSEEQTNAQYKSQVEVNSTETVWTEVLVFPALRELFKEGKLEQPGGRGTPYVLAKNIHLTSLKSDLNPNLVPEESIVQEDIQACLAYASAVLHTQKDYQHPMKLADAPISG